MTEMRHVNHTLKPAAIDNDKPRALGERGQSPAKAKRALQYLADRVEVLAAGANVLPLRAA